MNLQSKAPTKDVSGNYSTSILQFWQNIDHELYPHLKKEANRIISMFSTYMCEQSFSAMRRIKSAGRNRLLDVTTLKNLLVAATTNFLPDFAANEMQAVSKIALID